MRIQDFSAAVMEEVFSVNEIRTASDVDLRNHVARAVQMIQFCAVVDIDPHETVIPAAYIPKFSVRAEVE